MWIDLRIKSVTQWARGEPTTVMPYLSVGATHFDEGTVQPDGSIVYDLLNLWLQYEVEIPRRCKGLQFKADFRLTFNDDSWVINKVYGWGLGTADAPGARIPFMWDVPNRTSGLIKADIDIPAGTSWLWLTYSYAGQSSGYVADVTMPLLQGDAYGPGRVYKNGQPLIGVPHVCDGGKPVASQSYVWRNGLWSPTA